MTTRGSWGNGWWKTAKKRGVSPVFEITINGYLVFRYGFPGTNLYNDRLFYVAMTRTKNRVYFVAPEKNPSEFLLEIKKEYKNVYLHGKNGMKDFGTYK